MIDIYNYLNKLSKDTYSIYLFHGVISKNKAKIRNYNNKHILSTEFEKLLIELKRLGNPISLDDLINYHRGAKKLPPNSFSITFDDGFENNFSIAVPILEKLEIPATFYVSTNLIEKNLMSWIDQIEYCFELKDSISIKLPWDKNVLVLDDSKKKIEYLSIIRDKVKSNQKLYNPDLIVNKIFDQTNTIKIDSNDDPLDRKMNWEQVKSIHYHDLFSIGGHSHNHISLGSLKSNEAKKEIFRSIKILKDKADIESPHYSYPEGQRIDFNDYVINFLKKNKIECCPTAIDGVNKLKIDSLFHLKRVMVF
tara:strand:+ start:902 stop:1825 length:924 start_codon:yes stop_codon:yes gene_type:complete